MKTRLTIKERLEEMLLEAGWRVNFISANLGYWSHNHQDVCKWEGICWESDAQFITDDLYTFHSWYTMTECVRKGIVCIPDGPRGIEVSVKD